MESAKIRRNNIIKGGKTILVFDIDATLTPPRQPIEQKMITFLQEISQHFDIAAVGGSDLVKLKEQLHCSFPNFTYVFTENGLVGFKNGVRFHEKRIGEFLGEEKLKKFLKFCLRYIADLDIPIQRGTFIEYRTGLINVSPIGRNCSTEERKAFDMYNKETRVLEKFKEAVQQEFSDWGLSYAIGGQISFDCFPEGWDKTYCLQFLNEYDNVIFFGDKTLPGGNDYEIAKSESVTKSETVFGPDDTLEKVKNVITNDLEQNIFKQN